MKRPFLVFGTSALSRLLLELAGPQDRALLAGFTVDRAYMIDREFRGYPVYAFEDIPDRFPPDAFDIVAPLRYAAMNRERQQIFERVVEAGYEMPGYVHPSSRVSDRARLGRNVILFEDNIVRAGAVLGDNAFLWNRVLVDEGAEVGAHCFLAGGSVVERSARVGRNSFIGPKSVIATARSVGDHCLIGSGALIARDCRDAAVYGPAAALYGADGPDGPGGGRTTTVSKG